MNRRPSVAHPLLAAIDTYDLSYRCAQYINEQISSTSRVRRLTATGGVRGGELGVLRVREHTLFTKSTLSKLKKTS